MGFAACELSRGPKLSGSSMSSARREDGRARDRPREQARAASPACASPRLKRGAGLPVSAEDRRSYHMRMAADYTEFPMPSNSRTLYDRMRNSCVTVRCLAAATAQARQSVRQSVSSCTALPAFCLPAVSLAAVFLRNVPEKIFSSCLSRCTVSLHCFKVSQKTDKGFHNWFRETIFCYKACSKWLWQRLLPRNWAGLRILPRKGKNCRNSPNLTGPFLAYHTTHHTTHRTPYSKAHLTRIPDTYT